VLFRETMEHVFVCCYSIPYWMSLFQQLGLDGIKKLIDIHLCPFCIMRYCNVDDKTLLYFYNRHQLIK